jgi:hypothetical protein
VWEEKLAKGMPVTLKKGEFRRDDTGQIRKTQRKAMAAGDGRRRVPARKYTEHPETREACPHRRSREPAIAQKEQRTVCGDHKRASTGGDAEKSLNRRLAN